MKICIFSGYAIPHLGGVERYTDKIVEELSKLHNEITIVTTNDNNYPDYEKKENYEIYRLPVFNLFKNRYPILKPNKKYKKIIKEIEEKNFDAYICQTRFYLTSQVGVKLASKHKKIPIIIEHGSNHFTINNRVLDFFGEKYEHYLTNRLKKHNPLFYGVSNRCNNWLKHFNIEASGVLYNSVPEEAYEKFKNQEYIKNKKDNKVYIAYIGRIIKEKGVELLLDTIVELSKDYKTLELYIAGDGPKLEEYKAKYKSNNIHFEGKISYEQVMSLCNQIDIFIHPSMYPEGLPTSILESGLMRCAVIATDRGGTKEVINDSKYGLIMEENKESLKENLKSLLDNKEKIEIMKNNLQERILNNFTWKITAQKLLEEINKIS